MSGDLIAGATRVVSSVAASGGDDAARVVVPELAQAALHTDAVRGVRALEEYRTLTSILGKDRSAIGAADLEALAGLEALQRGPRHGLLQTPSPVRMSFGSLRHMPDRRWDIGVELDMLQGWSDRVEELARLRAPEHARLAADPDVTRASLTAEVRELVSRPTHEITSAQLERLAVIDTLPGAKRPGLPRPTRFSPELIVANGLDPQHWQAGNELRRIRLWAEQRAIMADRSLTGDRLRAEALSLAARSADELTFDEQVRLAAIQGVSDARGVGMPGPFNRRRIGGLDYSVEQNWRPRHREEARQEFEALRVWAGQVALDADPSVTKAALERELLDIAIRPRGEIGEAHLARIAMMDTMQGPARPSIARAADERDFRWLAVTGSVPRWSAPAQLEIAKLRPRELLLSDAGLDVIRDRVARGGALDASVLALLADDGEATLTRVGLSYGDLRRMSSDVLARAGSIDTSEHDILLNLQAVRLELAEGAARDAAAAEGLRTTSIELADRNIARLLGERRDTYGRNPDYAEVGRIVSNLELLRALRQAPDSPPAPATLGELLTW